MLPWIRPMTARLGQDAFNDESYLFEPKWDGGRILLYKHKDALDAFTRTGRKVTYQFPELKEAVHSIDSSLAVLDTEAVCLRQGRPVFDDFAYRGRLSKLATIEHAQRTHPITFIVFDILYAERSIMQEPLSLRKQFLKDRVGPTNVIAPTFYAEEKGQALYQLTREQNMEGIMAKRKDGIYLPGQVSPDWQKILHRRNLPTVILGYRTEPCFALVVGLHFRTIRNKPVGTVEAGFSKSDIEFFLQLAPTLHTKKDAKVQWVEPQICCQIEYLERSEMHQLKSLVFKGFLLEKKSEECVWLYN